jgi:hypothetical protein
MKPATFWTATPTNFWRDYVAVHSESLGFWFELPEKLDDTPGVCPMYGPLGEHKNNTFRSNYNFGIKIYPQYTPLSIPCDETSVPSPAYIRNMVNYRNREYGLFNKRMGYINHRGHTFLENGADDMQIIKTYHVIYNKNPFLKNILFVGMLDGSYFPGINLDKRAIQAPQQEYFFASNITFVNYGSSGAIGGCSGCVSGENEAQGGYTVRYENLKWINTDLGFRPKQKFFGI